MPPKVDVIIPHYKGYSILKKCVISLIKTHYQYFDIFIVNNGYADTSSQVIKEEFPFLNILNSKKNLGYAGGINFGFTHTSSTYAVFLNNDTEHEPSWLTEMVELAETDLSIAAIQPKMLDIAFKNSEIKKFDYAGAAGGRIDRLCYPFAYGRTFFSIEEDRGQYNHIRKLFWSSGAAMFVRRSSILELSYAMDETFFSHMEEVDLCWRLLSQNKKILACPSSIVFHHSGSTLKASSPLKTYLNHKNNITMIIKNKDRILFTLAMRFFLEIVASLFYLFKGKPSHAKVTLKALAWNIKHFQKTFSKRKKILSQKIVKDKQLFKGAPFSVFFISSK